MCHGIFHFFFKHVVASISVWDGWSDNTYLSSLCIWLLIFSTFESYRQLRACFNLPANTATKSFGELYLRLVFLNVLSLALCTFHSSSLNPWAKKEFTLSLCSSDIILTSVTSLAFSTVNRVHALACSFDNWRLNREANFNHENGGCKLSWANHYSFQ